MHYNILQLNALLQPSLVSLDHLSSATSFPKYQNFPRQITIFETSRKQPQPLFFEQKLDNKVL